jgi:fimbrial chaperone protein
MVMILAICHKARRSLILLLTALSACLAAHAATPVAIWPLDPLIEDGKSASALWLENRGTQTMTMQIRALAWTQQDGIDSYRAQSVLIASPPFAIIPAGKKQLIRLISVSQPQPGEQQAYRVLIDELPAAPAAGSGTTLGVRLQMRYSVPLFVNGKGIVAHKDGADPALATQPQLAWRALEKDGKTYMAIRNTGAVHARLTDVRLVRGADEFVINPGLLGHALPHAEMLWELPAAAPVGHQLQVLLRYRGEPVVIPFDRGLSGQP